MTGQDQLQELKATTLAEHLEVSHEKNGGIIMM